MNNEYKLPKEIKENCTHLNKRFSQDKERVMLTYCDSPNKVADSMRDGLAEIISEEQGKSMVRINHCIKCKYYSFLD